MAIDTAEKRRAIAGIPFWPNVTPNTDKDEEWRAQVAFNYSGILFTEVIPEPEPEEEEYQPPRFPYGDAPPRRNVPWRDKVSPELDRRLSEALERLERVSSEPPRKRRGKFARKRRKPEDLAPIPEGAPQEWLERAYEVLIEAQRSESSKVSGVELRTFDEMAEARRQKMVAELVAYYQAALREAQLEAERQYQLLLDEEAAILVVMMAA